MLHCSFPYSPPPVTLDSSLVPFLCGLRLLWVLWHSIFPIWHFCFWDTNSHPTVIFHEAFAVRTVLFSFLPFLNCSYFFNFNGSNAVVLGFDWIWSIWSSRWHSFGMFGNFGKRWVVGGTRFLRSELCKFVPTPYSCLTLCFRIHSDMSSVCPTIPPPPSELQPRCLPCHDGINPLKPSFIPEVVPARNFVIAPQ